MNKKNFTDKQLHDIENMIEQQRMFGYTDHQVVEILAKEDISISERHYKRMKRKIANREEVTKWITIQAKAGFIDNYKQRVEEATYQNQRLLRLFEYETSKPIEKQNVAIVSSLARGIRESIALLASLNLGSPVLLQVKELINKGGFTKDELTSSGLNTRDKESREDNTQDRTSRYTS